MTSSLLLPGLHGPATAGCRWDNCGCLGIQKSSFLSTPKLTFSPSRRTKKNSLGGDFSSPEASKSRLDRIPKQFRGENLKDGLMENYKNVPRTLYGLSPSQMNMFMTEDNPVHRQSKSVNEESISSRHNYLNNGGMYTIEGSENYSPSITMYGGAARGSVPRSKSEPPDLPSELLDARIVFLGMPIVPSVTELVLAQFMWLDFDNSTKPIHLYINSSGTQSEERELVGSETDAYAIADSIGFCKAPVYTVNVGMAHGQAAMLLGLGKKGYRALLPHASTKLYLPSISKSSGPATDMWIKSKELEANADSYLDLLSRSVGKPKEEIERDIRRTKYLSPQEAIDYGLADRIYQRGDDAFDKRTNAEALLAKSLAMRRAAGPSPSADSGYNKGW
ncbi:hypothetical protein DM860_015264 [Cuscuta australis]|uniref:ATP-dependent Clp protease proteolytic subunit n=1 Tax=Cuscuta australis TaxID=267555 RepID=A0A328D4P9_9ASTE|nr:hypothetical protein DM860_015264 [Cuscuta australis]